MIFNPYGIGGMGTPKQQFKRWKSGEYILRNFNHFSFLKKLKRTLKRKYKKL